MDTVLEKEPTLASHLKEINFRELGGFLFALVLAVCYEFLSWVESHRTVRD